MKKILILLLLSSVLVVSCSKVRESAGVTRKNIDESAFIENPPLVIPPDFNILPPDQLEEKERTITLVDRNFVSAFRAKITFLTFSSDLSEISECK